MKEFRALGLVCFLVMCISCGGGGGSTPGTDTTSKTVPPDLVVISPTASLSSAPENAFSKMSNGPLGDDYVAKKDAMEALVEGTGECVLAMGSPKVAFADCYGPTVYYYNWPGGSSSPQPYLPSGDLGIWSETEDGVEACSAAKMNSLVDGVSSTLDYMIGMMGVMACSGKKASVSLPAIGASVDMLPVLQSQATLNGISVTSAALSRVADLGIYPVYVSTVEATMDIGGASKPVFIRLKHVPTSDDNLTYRGKLSMYVVYDVENEAGGQGCTQMIFGGTDRGGVLATTILYEKTATKLTYEMNNAIFCGTEANPFLDENGVDDGKYNLHSLNYAEPVTREAGWGSNWHYGLFDLDPNTGLGSVKYAWQAGKNDEASRIFNIAVAADAAGETASGKAYAGHGNDITDSANLGAIKGFICNYTGPGAWFHADAIAANPNVQYQVLSRAAAATGFTASESHILYAPTNECSTTDGAFMYYAVQVPDDPSTIIAMDNNRPVPDTNIDPDFIPVTEVDFTPPVAPSDVD